MSRGKTTTITPRERRQLRENSVHRRLECSINGVFGRLSLFTVAAISVLAAAAGTASAHQSSFTYSRLDLSEDKKELVHEIKILSTDLFEALELEKDRDATSDEIRAGEIKLFGYVTDRVVIETPGAECKRDKQSLEIAGGRDRYAVIAFVYTCANPISSLALDYQMFFDLDARHIGLLLVEGETIQLTSPDLNRFEWTIGSPIEGGMGFIRSGIEHIVYGLDHILFLFALLLMAVITRSVDGGWKVRPIREAFAYTAAIVTAFTIAHSLTLVAAALGWIDLPSRLVESVIAASIVYVAIENVLRPDPPHRYLVTFVFGLIHGLGFAAMLRPLLPADETVVSLLLFNVGVELGQIGIVVIALPLLYGLARLISADRYRRRVLPLGAICLGTLGLVWLVERAFEVTILGL